jgi:peptidoglycan/LPS O-acetylase OafA/YrhL
MRSKHVIGIDALRFLAASLVFLFHFSFLYLIQPGAFPTYALHMTEVYNQFWSIAKFGWVGVEVFFVISGYVISFSTENRGRISYIRSRFLRLWPTVWICATVCLIISTATHQSPLAITVVRWAGSMLISPVGPYIDNAYWTLPIEIAFYVVVGAIAAGRDPSRLTVVAIVLAIISLLYWIIFAILSLYPISKAEYSLVSRIVNSPQLILYQFITEYILRSACSCIKCQTEQSRCC